MFSSDIIMLGVVNAVVLVIHCKQKLYYIFISTVKFYIVFNIKDNTDFLLLPKSAILFLWNCQGKIAGPLTYLQTCQHNMMHNLTIES